MICTVQNHFSSFRSIAPLKAYGLQKGDTLWVKLFPLATHPADPLAQLRIFMPSYRDPRMPLLLPERHEAAVHFPPGNNYLRRRVQSKPIPFKSSIFCGVSFDLLSFVL